MRRRSEPHTFDDRLNEEKARIEAELEATEPGPQRDLLGLMLSQIETAFHIDRWVSSTDQQDITLPRIRFAGNMQQAGISCWSRL